MEEKSDVIEESGQIIGLNAVRAICLIEQRVEQEAIEQQLFHNLNRSGLRMPFQHPPVNFPDQLSHLYLLNRDEV